jgi:hypothetical protein
MKIPLNGVGRGSTFPVPLNTLERWEIAGRREAGCQSQGVREPAAVDRSANGPRDYDQAGRRHIGSPINLSSRMHSIRPNVISAPFLLQTS